AEKLAERIQQLGGTPLLNPAEWMKKTNCGYEEPANPNTVVLLEQNIKGEQCAIETYKKLIDFVRGKDDITYHLIFDILKDEVEHEEDLEAILEDMKTPVK
ncbi:MAG TPA: ferritin-like domain-containing protein, partial [Candidatus Hydrogenedentes bacterium]|nr:ferritin-like domain-containing protein [Candidatus Hydrogenedentota bacterium]